MNKYYQELGKILAQGKTEGNKKGRIRCLINEAMTLKSITLFLGNVHIYENNIEKTRQLLGGDENIKFELNV